MLYSFLKKRLKKRKLLQSTYCYECEFNIVVLGSDRVGKTSILNRIAKKMFAEEHMPTAIEVHEHILTTDDIKATFKFHDISCKHEFSLTRRNAIISADAFILVFSTADRQSFEDLEKIKLEIEALKKTQISDLPVITIGNKIDIGRLNITSDEILKYCQNEMDSVFMECSAKNEKDLSYICPVIYDELGVCGLLYEKVLAIQCKEEVSKLDRKLRLSVN